MKASMSATLSVVSALLLLVSLAASDTVLDRFLKCLPSHSLPSHPISQAIYSNTNPSFESILQALIKNRRFLTPTTPKPLAIIAAVHESHVQATVVCAKSNGLQIRIRSGGHDYEGLSYVSQVPFVILDMFNLRSIDVDVASETAWVQSGATLGELYHSISSKSNVHGFPAGVCPTVGIGGHFSGGGFGTMMRKYGLSVDNIIDAQLVDVNGNILNRKTMGEDLFWAIRGGGPSFGAILSWKISLVQVPPTVTAFKVARTLEEGATDVFCPRGGGLVVGLGYSVQQTQVQAQETTSPRKSLAQPGGLHVPRAHKVRFPSHVVPPVSKKKKKKTDVSYKWQLVASKLDKELFIRATSQVVKGSSKGSKKISISFIGLFLGQSGTLLSLLSKSFPELGLQQKDCKQMRWIESVVFWANLPNATSPDVLLNRPSQASFFKKKSDFVKHVIPKNALENIWKVMMKVEPIWMQWNPYGGRMDEIPATATPFPHRAGNLFKIEYSTTWIEQGVEAINRHTSLLRQLHDAMAPYVSKYPREAFLNYRDLDIGSHPSNQTNFEEARVYGSKYFKENFLRLVTVKSRVDPENFFKNEQSIPVNSA